MTVALTSGKVCQRSPQEFSLCDSQKLNQLFGPSSGQQKLVRRWGGRQGVMPRGALGGDFMTCMLWMTSAATDKRSGAFPFITSDVIGRPSPSVIRIMHQLVPGWSAGHFWSGCGLPALLGRLPVSQDRGFVWDGGRFSSSLSSSSASDPLTCTHRMQSPHAAAQQLRAGAPGTCFQPTCPCTMLRGGCAMCKMVVATLAQATTQA